MRPGPEETGPPDLVSSLTRTHSFSLFLSFTMAWLIFVPYRQGGFPVALCVLSPPLLIGKRLATWSGYRMRRSLPLPTLQQALFAQLEPARSAGVALHAVGSFTGPAGVMAGHTPVAVLVSVVAFWAAFNTGRVC